MSKGRWVKHRMANPKILDILRRSGSHMTTNEIKSKLYRKYNIALSWSTMQAYLRDMSESGHVEGIEIQKKNTIWLWKIKNEISE